MNESYDVVVIGAGLAGLTAARRSQQLGASVALIEKGTENDGNTTRRSGGAFHAAYFDPTRHGPDELYEALIKSTDGHARPDVARAWADNVRRSLEFLKAEGAVFERDGKSESHWNRSGPPPLVTEAIDSQEPNWKGAANDRLLTRMTRSFVDAGGTWLPATRAVGLEAIAGVVGGVHVEPRSGGPRTLVRGRTVVMADGGFQGNPDLVARYITTHMYCRLCSELATGDCLAMATAIGAKAVELDAAYQWVVLRDRVTHPGLAHPPSPTWIINASMVVDGRGERIGDEALETPPSSAGEAAYPSNQYSDKRLSGIMAKRKTSGDCWVVFDDAVWTTQGRKARLSDPSMPQMANSKHLPLNPTIVEHGGTFLTAPSIVDLANEAGLPPEILQRSVEAFNRFSRDGTPLNPSRSARPQPIAQAPFHAIPVVPGIFFTMGGVLVNGNGQVLDEGEQPIPGLYAAGGTMGGLQGGPRQGYAGGWSAASTFGLLTAEHATSQVRRGARVSV